LKLHLNPYLLVISGKARSKYWSDGNTISGANGSEEITAHGAGVQSSGPSSLSAASVAEHSYINGHGDKSS
jgi:hypothetical protein